MKLNSKGKIKITKDGPYLVSGNLPLKKEIIIAGIDGIPEKWQDGEKFETGESYSLCRCGESKNPPFCDGTHASINFDGAETASREKYLEQAQKFSGPDLDLTDVEPLCAMARFCEKGGSIWRLIENSDDPEAKKLAIRESCDCPAGRLVAWNKKTKKAIEPDFEESLSIVEDPQLNLSGPIWVKGGVEIESSDGAKLEKRNRVSLCRCGKSLNKPYCDATHLEIGFNDEK